MTATQKNTPGPWNAHNWRVIAEVDGFPICDVEPRLTGDITAANARLIAAAPELFEALKDLEAIASLVSGLQTLHGQVSPEKWYSLAIETERARHIMAHAEGKE